MSYLHGRISNMPANPREILDAAISVCYDHWVDEKGTEDHPSVWQRQPSKLTYEEAFEIIQNAKPHWVTSYRDEGYITGNPEDSYWEFGGCNIASNNYGEVFIWIKVRPSEAEKIFKQFDLQIEWY